jgi:hypothetical protein
MASEQHEEGFHQNVLLSTKYVRMLAVMMLTFLRHLTMPLLMVLTSYLFPLVDKCTSCTLKKYMPLVPLRGPEYWGSGIRSWCSGYCDAWPRRAKCFNDFSLACILP